MQEQVRFWLDVAPQIIAIIIFAIISWRRISHLSNHVAAHDIHLAAHDEHNTGQDIHLRVLDKHNTIQDKHIGLYQKPDNE